MRSPGKILQHCTRSGHSESGFSLVELLVVLGIIAVVASMTATLYYVARPGIELDQGLQEVEAILNRAKVMAAMKGNNYIVEFYQKGATVAGTNQATLIWMWRLVDDDGWKDTGPLDKRSPFNEDLTQYFDLNAANNGIYDGGKCPREMVAESKLTYGLYPLRSNITANPNNYTPRVIFFPDGRAVVQPVEAQNILRFATRRFSVQRYSQNPNDKGNLAHLGGIRIEPTGGIIPLRNQTR